MPSKTYSQSDLILVIDPSVIPQVNVWLERGDGVAIYENVDLGHPMLGHKIFLSFGSPEAQIENDEPPGPCPIDLGRMGLMHWRYHLDGTYKGDPLPLMDFEDEEPDES